MPRQLPEIGLFSRGQSKNHPTTISDLSPFSARGRPSDFSQVLRLIYLSVVFRWYRTCIPFD